jgi:hypothetical protein
MGAASEASRSNEMVDNCANPKCNKPLRYLRDGRVFTFSVPGASVGPNGQRLPHVEHYWLCGDCAVSLTVERLPGSAVRVLPLPLHATPRASRTAVAS